ncbi:hypothetical protein FOL47_005281 [Perkinsus chesapeaki]|uniref:Uncharacterized protein n=1 Tax=Perkinsus chesapeaki TaxID=330153 RepID=A0A7J6LY76_PERCH|nr:hypothetical protein FOL47_005281 [Perkinsus chesapeaki]
MSQQTSPLSGSTWTVTTTAPLDQAAKYLPPSVFGDQSEQAAASSSSDSASNGSTPERQTEDVSSRGLGEIGSPMPASVGRTESWDPAPTELDPWRSPAPSMMSRAGPLSDFGGSPWLGAGPLPLSPALDSLGLYTPQQQPHKKTTTQWGSSQWGRRHTTIPSSFPFLPEAASYSGFESAPSSPGDGSASATALYAASRMTAAASRSSPHSNSSSSMNGSSLPSLGGTSRMNQKRYSLPVIEPPLMGGFDRNAARRRGSSNLISQHGRSMSAAAFKSQHIAWNRELTNPNATAQQILSLAKKHCSQFNSVNWATTFHRLAKFHLHEAKSEHSLEIQTLLGKCESVEGFAPQHLATLAWAMAKLHIVDHDLLSKVVHKSLTLHADLKPQDLANLSWALARLDCPESDLMYECVCQKIMYDRGCLSQFKPMELASVMWAIATAGYDFNGNICKVCEVVARFSMKHWGLSEFSPQAIANMSWSLSYYYEPNAAPSNASSSDSVTNDGVDTPVGSMGGESASNSGRSEELSTKSSTTASSPTSNTSTRTTSVPIIGTPAAAAEATREFLDRVDAYLSDNNALLVKFKPLEVCNISWALVNVGIVNKEFLETVFGNISASAVQSLDSNSLTQLLQACTTAMDVVAMSTNSETLEWCPMPVETLQSLTEKLLMTRARGYTQEQLDSVTISICKLLAYFRYGGGAAIGDAHVIDEGLYDLLAQEYIQAEGSDWTLKGALSLLSLPLMEMYRPGVLEVFSGRVVSGDIDLPVSAMSELISTLEMVLASEECAQSPAGEESKSIIQRSNSSIVTMCARAMAEQNDLSLPLVQRMRALTDDFSSLVTPLLSLLLEEAQSFSALIGTWTSDAIAAAAVMGTSSEQLSSVLNDSITICDLLANTSLTVMDESALRGLLSALTEAYYQKANGFEADMISSLGACLASTLSHFGPQDASRFLDTLSEDACSAARIEKLLPGTCLTVLTAFTKDTQNSQDLWGRLATLTDVVYAHFNVIGEVKDAAPYSLTDMIDLFFLRDHYGQMVEDEQVKACVSRLQTLSNEGVSTNVPLGSLCKLAFLGPSRLDLETVVLPAIANAVEEFGLQGLSPDELAMLVYSLSRANVPAYSGLLERALQKLLSEPGSSALRILAVIHGLNTCRPGMVGSYVALGPSGSVTSALLDAARCPGHCIQTMANEAKEIVRRSIMLMPEEASTEGGISTYMSGLPKSDDDALAAAFMPESYEGLDTSALSSIQALLD